jgi:hypothetical protein
MHSPARNSEERADARVSSERAVRSERGICRQLAACGRINNAWTSEATYNRLKREHTRLFLSATNAYPTCRGPIDGRTTQRARARPAHPRLSSRAETRQFGCCKVVHDGESDGGGGDGVYVRPGRGGGAR